MQSTQHTECDEISLYTDESASAEQIKTEVKKLLSAFPDIDNNYIIVLIDRLIANKFTKQRVCDAISSIIDTCHYKRPMIAEIVSFDRKMKLFTYSEMVAKCSPNYTSENFGRIEINGQIRYYEK
jgi:hypothetical protein